MPQFDASLRVRLLSAAFALLIGSSSGAVALGLELGWPGLTDDDIVRMHAAAARLYEGRSIGTIERWRSPASKDAGEVKLIRSFDANGMPCRTIDYLIRFETARDMPDHYVVNWCRVPGGIWKIVELAQPR